MRHSRPSFILVICTILFFILLLNFCICLDVDFNVFFFNILGFGDDHVTELTEKFRPVLSSQGVETQQLSGEWALLKSLVYRRYVYIASSYNLFINL